MAKARVAAGTAFGKPLIPIDTAAHAALVSLDRDYLSKNMDSLLAREIGREVDVFAEVNSGKVIAVTAAGMQVKKVKSRQKLAETTPGITLASMQLAQADVYYYGYWVYDDLTDYYYWFPADYVIVDSSWVEYVA